MLKVGIIGTGAIASSHIEAYFTFPSRCKIVALCDIYPEKAESTASRFNLDADIYNDYQAMLERADIDLISICTPPYTHANTSIDALNAGKHVLVEKPMASSLDECDRMLAAAEKITKFYLSLHKIAFARQ